MNHLMELMFKSENMILELILELRTKGYLIIISTHDINMAMEYCN